MKKILLLLVIASLFACNQTNQGKKEAENETLVVLTTNYPLFYFADKISGTHADVLFPAPANVDPAYWVPSDTELQMYQQAGVIFSNGAGYDKWMDHVSLPSSRIVNTTREHEDKYIQLKHVTTHSHGPEGEHEHVGHAFTTWLDFELAAKQAESVKNGLMAKLPKEGEELLANYDELKTHLGELDDKMHEIATDLGTVELVGSHPVYQYLAKAYGLRISSVHFEPDELPTKKQWGTLRHLVEDHGAKIMLWEDQPLPEVVQILEDMQVKVVVFNPCGNKPESGDFLSVMAQNVENLAQAI